MGAGVSSWGTSNLHRWGRPPYLEGEDRDVPPNAAGGWNLLYHECKQRWCGSYGFLDSVLPIRQSQFQYPIA